MNNKEENKNEKTKDKILLFVIGVLVGAVISTAAFLVCTKTIGPNKMQSGQTQQMQGGTPPQMPGGQNSQSSQSQPPAMPSEQNNQQDQNQSSGTQDNNTQNNN